MRRRRQRERERRLEDARLAGVRRRRKLTKEQFGSAPEMQKRRIRRSPLQNDWVRLLLATLVALIPAGFVLWRVMERADEGVFFRIRGLLSLF